MGVQDFYRSICSFYIGLLEHLVDRYGKNNPVIINIAHSFENFLQTCDFLEPLPGGYAQFTGMMAGIICNIYHIDLDELKDAAHEIRGEPSLLEEEELKDESALTKDELKAVIKEARAKTNSRRERIETANYDAKASRVLTKLQGANMNFSDEMKSALAEAMKLDEREFRSGRLRLKKGKEPLRK